MLHSLFVTPAVLCLRKLHLGALPGRSCQAGVRLMVYDAS